MNIVFVLIPIAILFVVIAVGVFFWAIRADQFEDLDRQGSSILFDEERPPATVKREQQDEPRQP